MFVNYKCNIVSKNINKEKCSIFAEILKQSTYDT